MAAVTAAHPSSALKLPSVLLPTPRGVPRWDQILQSGWVRPVSAESTQRSLSRPGLPLSMKIGSATPCHSPLLPGSLPRTVLAVVSQRTLPPSPLVDGPRLSAAHQMRRPCPDQKVRAQPVHSLSGSWLHLHLGSIGWPLSLSGQEIRALLPEGP
eukprot:2958772-Pleurochrysis_carterae.AAC.1